MLRERGAAKAVGINLWCVGGDWGLGNLTRGKRGVGILGLEDM